MYIVVHVIMTNCNKHEIVENLTVGTNQQVHSGNFYGILITFQPATYEHSYFTLEEATRMYSQLLKKVSLKIQSQ